MKICNFFTKNIKKTDYKIFIHCLKIRQFAYKYLKYLEFNKIYSPHTIKSYCIDLRQFLLFYTPNFMSFLLTEKKRQFFDLSRNLSDFSKITDLNSVNPQFLNQILETLIKKSFRKWARLSPATQNRKYACIKSFLKWLFIKGLINKDLQEQIRLPALPQSLPHYLSVDEALSLVQTVRKQVDTHLKANDKRDLILILLLYGGGLRVSEACGLKWNQVDFSKSVLRIKGKGGKWRLSVVPDLVLTYLKEGRKKSGFIFNPPLPTRKAYDRVKYWGQKAGLNKPLSPHVLRHSFATHLLNSGSDLRTLQELLGHKSLASTQRYTHLHISHLTRLLEHHHPLKSTYLKKGQTKKSQVPFTLKKPLKKKET